jgi:hypothetical protein
MEWLDITQIIMLLAACFSCYMWGRSIGISAAIEALLHKKIITEKDLEKFDD